MAEAERLLQLFGVVDLPADCRVTGVVDAKRQVIKQASASIALVAGSGSLPWGDVLTGGLAALKHGHEDGDDLLLHVRTGVKSHDVVERFLQRTKYERQCQCETSDGNTPAVESADRARSG